MKKISFTLLHRAIKKGNVSALATFFKEHCDPNFANRFGWTLLMFAALEGNTEILKQLLDNGADVNIKNKFGDSALSLAAISCHPKAVEFLLSRGADVTVEPHGVSLLKSLKSNVIKSSRIYTMLEKAGAH
jgi:uncharacterized protein